MIKRPVQEEIRYLMKKGHVPGLSIVMIENGEIESHYNYGLKNGESADLIESDTVFEAASLSKPVFAYGILQMVQEGLLDLDVPLVEYLPYPDVKNDRRVELITARMVLAHTTGFPNWRQTSESLKIYFQPGERFSYSGEGFVYLQKVAEHLLELPLESMMCCRVFKPLEMTHSSFIWQKEYEKLKASGHDANGVPIESPRPSLGNAAFTLYTTAVDYAKFSIAIMKGTGLKPETMNQMMTPQIRVEAACVNCVHKYPGKLSDSIFWGLGWGLQRVALGDAFWHWGDNHGFKSYVVGLMQERRAMIVFTNSSNGLGLSIIPQIVDKIWGTWQPAFDWINTEKTPF
jgi:CubicO group peptidase (beta-lactamase class C family)